MFRPSLLPVFVIRAPRIMLPRYFQSRYRRHLINQKRSFSTSSRETISSPTFSFHYSLSYKNFTSFKSNLGRMCVKQISSLFTIKSHKESLCAIFLFRDLVATPSPDIIVRFFSVHLFVASKASQSTFSSPSATGSRGDDFDRADESGASKRSSRSILKRLHARLRMRVKIFFIFARRGVCARIRAKREQKSSFFKFCPTF